MLRAVDMPAPWMRERSARWDVGEHELLESPDVGDLVAATERGVAYGRSVTASPTYPASLLLVSPPTIDGRGGRATARELDAMHGTSVELAA